MQRILFVVLIPLVLLIASCAKEPMKDAGLQGEGALSAVHGLAGAYSNRDLEAFMDRVSPAYAGRQELRNSAERTFAIYQNIRVAVQPRKILIEVKYKGNIRATFAWDGEWKTSGGRTVKDGGRATFVLDPGTYKLLSIEGRSPFEPSAAPVPVRQQ